ncbi:hypothetical protein BJV77DRAFT_968332 [Russula vinacea]|nr:hypothetical protein BJV77DRAFT_968332 [Russula vinacea]
MAAPLNRGVAVHLTVISYDSYQTETFRKCISAPNRQIASLSRRNCVMKDNPGSSPTTPIRGTRDVFCLLLDAHRVASAILPSIKRVPLEKALGTFSNAEISPIMSAWITEWTASLNVTGLTDLGLRVFILAGDFGWDRGPELLIDMDALADHSFLDRRLKP